MNRTVQRRRKSFIFVLATSLSLVIAGLLLAEFLRLAACPLCIIQRALYLALALFAALGLAVHARPLVSRLAGLAMVVAAGTGIFVAGYQVWIQRFAPSTNCSPYPTWWEDLVDRAGEIAPVLFKASGLCSDPAWKFLGLSIADWSLGGFTILALVSLGTLAGKR